MALSEVELGIVDVVGWGVGFTLGVELEGCVFLHEEFVHLGELAITEVHFVILGFNRVEFQS